jgi:ribosomal protein S16
MSDAEDAAGLFQKHRDELGFVNVAQCREKDLYLERRDGDVVGAALGNHCVRKPQTTLYDIAVADSHKRSGVAGDLIEKMKNDSPHEKMVAKCPIDLDAMNFYRETGWVLQDVEGGKNTPLAVWGKRI